MNRLRKYLAKYDLFCTLLIVVFFLTIIPSAFAQTYTTAVPPPLLALSNETIIFLESPDHKPLYVTIQVDLEDELDNEYIFQLLDVVEEHEWRVPVYVTGEFASRHPDTVREVYARGHKIAVGGWQKGEDLTLFDYPTQRERINRSLMAIEDALGVQLPYREFRPQQFQQNRDTFKALQDLDFQMNTGFIATTDSYRFPYYTDYNFLIMPISTIQTNNREVPLVDTYFFPQNETNNVTCQVCLFSPPDELYLGLKGSLKGPFETSSFGFQAHSSTAQEYLTLLKKRYDEITMWEHYFFVVVHPSIIAGDTERFTVFKEFLDYIEEKGGTGTRGLQLTLGGWRCDTSKNSDNPIIDGYYISGFDANGPESAFPSETVSIHLQYYGMVSCPAYYFTVFGKYESDIDWHYLGRASMSGTGQRYFDINVVIPEPTNNDHNFTILATGRACSGTCWPQPTSFEVSDSFLIVINSSAFISLNAKPSQVSINSTSTIVAQLKDLHGAQIAKPGVMVTFAEITSPEPLGILLPQKAITDENGSARASFLSMTQEGIAHMESSASEYAPAQTSVQITRHKPKITAVKSRYTGAFMYAVSAINNFDTYVEWTQQDAAPLRIEYTLNGVTISQPARLGSPLPLGDYAATQSYDTGLDLVLGENWLEVVATEIIDGEEVRSEPYVSMVYTTGVHTWLMTYSPTPAFYPPFTLYDNGLIFEFFHMQFPDPAVDVAFDVPEQIPIIGGAYGLKLDVEGKAAYNTLGLGLVEGGGTVSVDVGGTSPKREMGIDIMASGELNLSPQIYLDELGIDVTGWTSFEYPWNWWIAEFAVIIQPELGGGAVWGASGPDMPLDFKSGEVHTGSSVEGVARVGTEGLAQVEGGLGGKPSGTFQFCNGCDYLKEFLAELWVRAKVTYMWVSEEMRWVWSWKYPETLAGFFYDSDVSAWTPLQREYIHHDYSLFRATELKTITDTSGSTTETSIIENIFPYANPSFAVSRNDSKLLVWVYDDPAKNLSQSFELQYSSWNGLSWSNASFITNNTITDVGPVVSFDQNGKGIAVWTVIANENLPVNITPTETFPYLEIYYALFDPTTLQWSEPSALTQNNVLDFLPSLASDTEGNLMLLWIQDTDNNISLIGEDIPFVEDVYATFWNGFNWTTPSLALHGIGIDARPSFGFNGTDALLVWSQDTDGNLTSQQDRELFFASYKKTWSLPRQLTVNNYEDVMPVVFYDTKNNADVLWAINELNLTTNATIQRLFFTQYQGQYDNWSMPQQITTFSTGINELRVAPDRGDRFVAMWESLSEQGLDLFYSVYDPRYNYWSTQKQLTHDHEIESAMTLGIDSAGMIWTSYLKTNITIVNETFEGTNITLPMPHFNASHLYVLNHERYTDVGILDEGLRSSNENPELGETVSFNATITNLGDLLVENISVAFFDNMTLLEEKNISMLQAGVNITLSLDWTIPLLNASHLLRFVVDPYDSIIEQNESNNEQNTFIILPDLVLSSIHVTYLENQTINVSAKIENIGTITASPVIVRFYDSNISDDHLIAENNLPSLDANHSTTISVLWNVSSLNESLRTVYGVIDPLATLQELNQNNNQARGVSKVFADLVVTSEDILFANTAEGNQTITLSLLNKGNALARDISILVYDTYEISESSLAQGSSGVDSLVADSLSKTSADGTLGTETRLLLNTTLSSLMVNNNTPISFSWITTKGMHQITTILDEDNRLLEIDEGNNVATTTVVIVQGMNISGIRLIDNDRDNLSNYLATDVLVNISEPMNYTLVGSLFKDQQHIADASAVVYLDQGIRNVTLYFNGYTFWQYSLNGPYTLRNFRLFDQNGVLVSRETSPAVTSAYNYTAFQRPPAFFIGNYQDYGLDSDGDLLYNVLIVKTGINVTKAGNYTLTGILYDQKGKYLTSGANSSFLPRGIYGLSLQFDGMLLSAAAGSGSFNLTRLVLSIPEEIDNEDQPYQTRIYNITSFQAGGNLSGIVFDENNVPIPNATLRALGRTSQSVTSDENGLFTLSNLLNGTYTLIALPPEGSNFLSVSNQTMISLRSITYLNISLPSGGMVRGMVRALNGSPVVAARIQMAGSNSYSVVSTQDGTYNFTGVIPGAYTIDIIPPVQTPLKNSAGYITVAEDQVTLVDSVLEYAAIIAGRVINQSGGGVSDELVYLSGFETPFYATDENGDYAVPMLDSGTYTVNIDDPTDWNMVVNGVYAGTGRSINVEASINGTTWVDFTKTTDFDYIDLTLTPSDIFFSNETPREGLPLWVTATIHNTGTSNVSSVPVGLFKGDPSLNISIGAGTLELIPAQGEVNLSIIVQPSLPNGTSQVYVSVDPDNRINEINETNNVARRLINVSEDLPPVFINPSFSPENGSWDDTYTFTVNVTDPEADNVQVLLQIFANQWWQNISTLTCRACGQMQELTFSPSFTPVERNQSLKFRFFYSDEVRSQNYSSGVINSGYFPSKPGLDGPQINDEDNQLGIVEGAGATYGSSFYSWSNQLYTLVQEGDEFFVTASDSINRIAVYDYLSEQWFYYRLNATSLRGERTSITLPLQAHMNHFVQIQVFYETLQRSFHMVKTTKEGGMVEGAYGGYGNAFTSWDTTAQTLFLPGERLYVVADSVVNKLGIYNYANDQWYYADLINIGDAGAGANATYLPRGKAIEITSYLVGLTDHFVQIKVLQDDVETNFHMIKKSQQGGIVEGAEGSQQGGSFSLWSTALYTVPLVGDTLYVTPNSTVNTLEIYDYGYDRAYTYSLNETTKRGMSLDVTPFLENHTTHLIKIRALRDGAARMFHMVKKSPNGGMVEGGYANTDASFGSWSSDLITFFGKDERLLLAPDESINLLQIYDYSDDQWYSYTLSNTYPAYQIMDITSYLLDHENHLITIQTYFGASKKNYHLIKRVPLLQQASNETSILQNASVFPSSGSWNDDYTYTVEAIPHAEGMNLSLQILTNNQWQQVATQFTRGGIVSFNHTFTPVDRNQTTQYRFLFSENDSQGYYLSLDGTLGPYIDNSSYGRGIVEGGGASYGSSFYTWDDDLYTAIQTNDRIFIVASEPIDTLEVYDYYYDNTSTYQLGRIYQKGMEIDITPFLQHHLDDFLRLRVMFQSSVKLFHMLKETETGAIQEGGYPGYGGSFTNWQGYAYTMVLPDDRLYVAPKADINKVGVYNLSSGQWRYYFLGETASAQRLVEISKTLREYENALVQIQVYDDNNQKDFHLIKRNNQGGIIEGADGNQPGSSFYSWYTYLYTTPQKGDQVYIAGPDPIDRIKILDYITNVWEEFRLNRTYGPGEVIDISKASELYANRFVQIKAAQFSTDRNFHMIKVSPAGGIVEGAYPDDSGSFSRYSTDFSTLLREDERILITPNDFIDRVYLYDYSSNQWYNYSLLNVYPKYALVDITEIIREHTQHFIRLQVFYQRSQKSYHLIKVNTKMQNSSLPDLTIDADLQFSNPDLLIGESTVIRARVRNSGQGDAPYVRVRAHDGSMENGTIIGTVIITKLRPGEEVSVPIAWSNVSLGNHNITVFADPLYEITEKNESNNQVTTLFSILPDVSLKARDIQGMFLLQRIVTLHEISGRDLLDYPVAVSLDTATLVSRDVLRQDCGDLRIATMEGQPLSYWLESGCNTNNTRLWFKIPRLSANSTLTVALSYGNNSATGQSNGKDVFDIFENWEEGPINTSYWTLGGSVSPYWRKYSSTKYEGNFSSGNNDIADRQISWIEKQLNLSLPASLVFYWSVSSEQNQDFLYYCVQNISCSRIGGYEERISGTVSWTKVSKGLTEGLKTLRFAYEKNANTTAGSDTGWIDALVVRKYALVEPELILGPELIVPGTGVLLATVANNGGDTAYNLSLDFYDGTPENGTLIGRSIVEELDSEPWFKSNTDLDRDGNSELILGSYANGITIIDPVNKTTLWSYNPGNWCNALALGDVNSNGNPELIFSCGGTSTFYVFRYPGAYPLVNMFNATVDRLSSEGGITIGDVDNDGIAEMIIADQGPSPDEIEIWGWNGSTFIRESTFIAEDTENIHSLAVEDVDNDGTMEIIFNEYRDTNAKLQVYGYDHGVYVREWVSEDLGGYLQGIALGDTDNDGNIEIWTGDRDHYAENNKGAVFVYQYISAGYYRQEWMSLPGENGFSRHLSPTSIADWDGDGKDEIAIGSSRALDEDGHVWVYESDGNDGYVLERDIKLPSLEENPTSPLFGDYDNDGDSELMIGDKSGWIYIYDSEGNLEWSNGDYGQDVGGWSGDAALITGALDPRSQQQSLRKVASLPWNNSEGLHEISVVLDSLNIIEEKSEVNNRASQEFAVNLLSDLLISNTDVSFSTPEPVQGQLVTINITIHNKGSASLSNVPVLVYDLPNIPNGSSSLLGELVVPLLSPNSSQTVILPPSGQYLNNWTLVSGNHTIIVVLDPLNTFTEQNETNNRASPLLPVQINEKPSFVNSQVTPPSGSWNNQYLYQTRVMDREGGDVYLTLEVYANGMWRNTSSLLCSWCTDRNITFAYNFTAVDLNQTTRYRFFYTEIWNNLTVQQGYYPSQIGLEGVVLDNTPYGLGIVEGAGAGYGSSFYSWSNTLYTVVEQGDEFIIAASDTVNLIQVYDMVDDLSYSYMLNQTYAAGTEIDITGALQNHQDHLVTIQAFYDTTYRNFHMIKQTKSGDFIEGGYAAYGSSFSLWSSYMFTFFRNGERLAIAPDSTVTRIGVYDYNDEYWQYYDLPTSIPRGMLRDITPLLAAYENKFIQIKALNGATERNFHLVKRTTEGGIVEGADGNQPGSSFYSWSSILYTVAQQGERYFVTPDNFFNNIRVYDYVTGNERQFNITRQEAYAAVDITPYLASFSNRLVSISLYQYDTWRNFHMVKYSPQGGIEEGAYPSGDGPFNSWSSDMYTLFRTNERILVAPDRTTNMVQIFNYRTNTWFNYSLRNDYPAAKLIDITNFIAEQKGSFILLNIYDGTQKNNFHLVKTTIANPSLRLPPVFLNASVTPLQGGWGDEFTYELTVAEQERPFTLSLQILTNGWWKTVATQNIDSPAQVTFTYLPTVTDRNQTLAYRFYYDDENTQGYFPSEAGLEGPAIDAQSYGLGIVEGAGAGYGSSFYSWSNNLYTVLQPNDELTIAADNYFNTLTVYDYSDDQSYTYPLGQNYHGGTAVELTRLSNLSRYDNHLIQLNVYFNNIPRNFHLVKKTASGDFIEGGYASYGSSFSLWSSYMFTFFRNGERLAIAPDSMVTRIGVYDYDDEYWQYYDLPTSIPRGMLRDITPLLAAYENKFIQIKALNGATERNFHLVKRTAEGGIVEGADGNQPGSSFYSWSSSLYTVPQIGESYVVAAEKQFNNIRIYDYNGGFEKRINISRQNAYDTFDITPYLDAFTNHLVQISLYQYDVLRNFHLVKYSPDGGIEEGAYPSADGPFNSWGSEMYTFFGENERLLITPIEEVTNLVVYDYATESATSYDTQNVYPANLQQDITYLLSNHINHFIKLQLYYYNTQKSYHLIKTSFRNRAPVLDPLGNQSLVEGETLFLALHAIDADNDPLVFGTDAAEVLPSDVSFNAITGEFSWTPTSNDSGVYVVTFNVTDGTATDQEVISITVVDMTQNSPPYLQPLSSITINETQQVMIQVNATDPENDTLSFMINDSRFVQQDNVFTWNTSYDDAGNYTFLITVSDGEFMVSELVNVTVLDLPLVYIVDNKDPGFVIVAGAWNLITITNAYAGNTRYNDAGTGLEKAAWLVDDLVPPATYDVYVWKFEHQYLGLMAKNAHYQIYHRNGVSPWIIRNLSTLGNEWIYLGQYEFDNSQTEGVLVSDEANGYVLADAVQLIYVKSLSSLESSSQPLLDPTLSYPDNEDPLLSFGSVREENKEKSEEENESVVSPS
ncbi:DUF2341 domain-containing protein [Candidatus Woesearchaeota archaeon]|nr:DUF2341 domain-containing protein [Candidatus Woesearchaeota archaeon]